MKKPLILIIVLSLIMGLENSYAQERNDQNEMLIYKQINIHFNSENELREIINLGIEPLTVKNKSMKTVLSDVMLQKLANNGIQYEVLIEDLQQDFIKRNKVNKTKMGDKVNTNCDSESTIIDYAEPSNFTLGSMGGYFTMEEVYQQFATMHILYPNLITALEPISSFETYEGRNLYVARLSDNPDMDENEPEILYTAIHHAREPESISQLIFYVWYLLENYESDPEVQTILNNTELYIVPLVNPDGYNYNAVTNPNGGGYWRKNRRDNGDGTFGVDPNRNYGVGWGTTGVSFDGNSDVYCGTGAFSEPETQAMKWLCENHDFKMALNNHTYSELLLFPYGYDYDQLTEDNEYYEIIAAHMVSQNGYVDEISSTLYPASGDSDDWMYDATANKPKIFSFTPEIGYDFWPVSTDIVPIAKEMMFLNLTASHLVTDYAIVTDSSPISVNTLTPDAAFSLQSLGLDPSNTFTISLEAISNNIVSVGDSQVLTDVDNMEVVTGNISYTLNSSISTGEIIEYKIVVDQGGYDTEVFVSKIFGDQETIFEDEAEDLNNWSTDGWGITTATYYSSPSSITDSPNGNYLDDNYSTLEMTSSIDLTEAVSANLTFYAKWDIENDYDFVQLLVNNQPQCGIYTNIGSVNQQEGQPLYDGTQSDWVEEYIDLNDYLGQQINVTFVFYSDQEINADGFYLDDLKINIAGAVGISEVNSEIPKITCYPNPANKQVIFSVDQLNINNHSELILTSQLGQEVIRRKFNSSTMTLDIGTLSEGIYYYSFQDEYQKTLVQKLVVVR